MVFPHKLIWVSFLGLLLVVPGAPAMAAQCGGSYTEGSRNFEVLKEWNKSSVYQKTISAFAARLDGGQ